MHATASGLCAVESDDVDGAVAELLEYLPSNTDEVPPLAPVSDSVLRPTPELRTVIPDRKAATYDVRDVVRALCDDGEFRELWPRWAGQIVTAFARLGGMPVGVRGQPAPHPGGHARHRGVAEGRPLRPPLRRLQPAHRQPGGHARASCRARTSSGAG